MRLESFAVAWREAWLGDVGAFPVWHSRICQNFAQKSDSFLARRRGDRKKESAPRDTIIIMMHVYINKSVCCMLCSTWIRTILSTLSVYCTAAKDGCGSGAAIPSASRCRSIISYNIHHHHHLLLTTRVMYTIRYDITRPRLSLLWYYKKEPIVHSVTNQP